MLDSDYAGSESGRTSRTASPTPYNEAGRLPVIHTSEVAAAVEGGAYQP